MALPSAEQVDNWHKHQTAVDALVIAPDPEFWTPHRIAALQLYYHLHPDEYPLEPGGEPEYPDMDSSPLAAFSSGNFSADDMLGSDMGSAPVASATYREPLPGMRLPSGLSTRAATVREGCSESGDAAEDEEEDDQTREPPHPDEYIPELTADFLRAREAKMRILKELYRKRFTQQGPNSSDMCLSCYHPGHSDPNDEHHCPVARLSTYIFKVDTPYTVGSRAGPLHLIDMFFTDIRLAALGYEWALEILKDGSGPCFGITSIQVGRLEDVLLQCKELIDGGIILPNSEVDHILSGELRVCPCSHTRPWLLAF